MRMPLTTRLYYGVGRFLPFLKIQPPNIDRQAAMALRPARNNLLSWDTRDGGETLITVPVTRAKGRAAGLVLRWLNVAPQRQVELDEVGGFVWGLCDGSNTIDAIVQKTGRHYKMNRREAEISVTAFLQTLHHRNFIGFYKKVGKRT